MNILKESSTPPEATVKGNARMKAAVPAIPPKNAAGLAQNKS
jgi:hypothetical protein